MCDIEATMLRLKNVGHKRRRGETFGIDQADLAIGFCFLEEITHVNGFRHLLALNNDRITFNPRLGSDVVAVFIGDFKELEILVARLVL